MTRHRSALYLSLAMVLAGVILITTFAPRAKGAQGGRDEYETPRTHQLVVCVDADCRPQGRPMNSTACALDLASVANVLPKGSRVSCRRIGK